MEQKVLIGRGSTVPLQDYIKLRSIYEESKSDKAEEGFYDSLKAMDEEHAETFNKLNEISLEALNREKQVIIDQLEESRKTSELDELDKKSFELTEEEFREMLLSYGGCGPVKTYAKDLPNLEDEIKNYEKPSFSLRALADEFDGDILYSSEVSSDKPEVGYADSELRKMIKHSKNPMEKMRLQKLLSSKCTGKHKDSYR